jgi:hypothetical protein
MGDKLLLTLAAKAVLLLLQQHTVDKIVAKIYINMAL